MQFIPLKKNLSPSSSSDFWPIALLRFLSKVIEMIVLDQLLEYFTTYHKLGCAARFNIGSLAIYISETSQTHSLKRLDISYTLTIYKSTYKCHVTTSGMVLRKFQGLQRMSKSIIFSFAHFANFIDRMVFPGVELDEGVIIPFPVRVTSLSVVVDSSFSWNSHLGLITKLSRFCSTLCIHSSQKHSTGRPASCGAYLASSYLLWYLTIRRYTGLKSKTSTIAKLLYYYVYALNGMYM